MYKIDDLIIYGSTGVCRVKDIRKCDLMGSGEAQLCYVLVPLYHDLSITTPVENTKVFMRPILTKQEAERLIDSIPELNTEAYHNNIMRQLEAHYKSYLDSHDCAELVKLTISLYSKKRQLQNQNRRFGMIDERFMKQAEELLFGELSAALNIPRDSVYSYIEAKLEKYDFPGGGSGETI